METNNQQFNQPQSKQIKTTPTGSAQTQLNKPEVTIQHTNPKQENTIFSHNTIKSILNQPQFKTQTATNKESKQTNTNKQPMQTLQTCKTN